MKEKFSENLWLLVIFWDHLEVVNSFLTPCLHRIVQYFIEIAVQDANTTKTGPVGLNSTWNEVCL